MSSNIILRASRSLRKEAARVSSNPTICTSRARAIHCLSKPSAPRASTTLGLSHGPQSRLSARIGSRSSLRWESSSALSKSSSTDPATSSNASSSSQEEIAKMEPRLSLTFTCTAQIPVPDFAGGAGDMETPPTQPCSHRSTHTFTKNAYQKGIVIIACPSCKNRCVCGFAVCPLFFADKS